VNDQDGVARITRSPALADLAVGMTIFVDRFLAPGGVAWGSLVNFVFCWLEVLRGERFEARGDFEAVFSSKRAFRQQCARRKTA
jgi:hypothetical protein